MCFIKFHACISNWKIFKIIWLAEVPKWIYFMTGLIKYKCGYTSSTLLNGMEKFCIICDSSFKTEIFIFAVRITVWPTVRLNSDNLHRNSHSVATRSINSQPFQHNDFINFRSIMQLAWIKVSPEILFGLSIIQTLGYIISVIKFWVENGCIEHKILVMKNVICAMFRPN